MPQISASDRKAAAIREADQIVSAAKSAGRDLTSDETAQVEAFLDTADEATREIEQAEAARKAAGRLEASKAAMGASSRRSHPGASNPAAPSVSTFSVGKESLEDDPQAGFKSPRQFMSAVMAYGKGRRDVFTAGQMKILAAAGSDEAGGYSEQFGGFLVPAAWQPGVLKVQGDVDPVGAMTRKVPMGSPSVKINARVDKDHSTSVSGGLRVYRRAEADTVTASRMQFEQIELQATSLFGIAYATEEILTDSPESFTSLIAEGFGEEFAAVKLEERLNGVGGGEFVGVRNAACTIDVSKESGQAAATIVYENILNMFARAWRPQMWLASKTCIPQLAAMSLAVGTGGSVVWMPNAQPGLPGTLLGIPIYYSERMQTVGTSGDIMLCNWGEYLEGNLGPMGQEESIHVRFVNHERAFKFYERNAGAPWWSTVLTPKNGSTLSPFVTLATRA